MESASEIAIYGKIFDSIYDGTLYGHWEAIVTMQQLIVLSTPDGVIDMTPQAMAARTSIPLDIITKGLKVLSEPDPYTRTPGEDGRRIALLDDHRPWGWRLVNHGKYRRLRDMDQKREADRDRIAEKRNKSKVVATTSQVVRDVAHSDSDSDSDSDSNTDTKVKSASAASRRPAQAEVGIEVWHAYASAFQIRYGVAPIRNAKVNGMLAQFLKRVPEGEAADIAAFYVGSNRGLYVSSKHCVDLLLRDAEGLRTEWATKRQGTDTEARQTDRTAATGNAFAPLIAEAEERERLADASK